VKCLVPEACEEVQQGTKIEIMLAAINPVFFLRSESPRHFFLLINLLGGTYILAVGLMGRGFTRFAKKRCRSGSKTRSFLHTMFQLGFEFHAVPSFRRLGRP
jgi:hypothetical protein